MDDMFDLSVYKDYKNALEEYIKKHNKKYFKDLITYDEIMKELNIKKLYPDIMDKFPLFINLKKCLLNIKQAKNIKKIINKDKKYKLQFTCSRKNISKDVFETKLNLSQVDLNTNLELAKEFMKNYNPDLYNYYEELNKMNHIKIFRNENHNISGISYNLDHSSPYVAILSKGNILDSDCLIHEMGHCYGWYKCDDVSKFNPIFDEVYSHYLQFLYYKYLQDQGLYLDDVKKLKKSILKLLKIHLNRLNSYYKGRINFDLFSVYNDTQYAYGQAIALYFYNKYLENPADADKLVETFLKYCEKYDEDDLAFDFLINKNDLITKQNVKNFLK